MMNPLIKYLSSQDPIPFEQYMDLALYHPEFGYYATRVDFGSHGDFVTAPTLTPEFAQALGHFLLTHANITSMDLIELGPGNGQLAYDLLTFLATAQKLPQRYYLVETSQHLKCKQQQLLKKLPKDVFSLVEWVSLDELQARNALIIANEFFDALPVVRFRVTETGIKEIYIHVLNEQLIEVLHEPRSELLRIIKPLNLPIGYTSELCLAYAPLALLLSKALRQGLLLVIDYGYAMQEYYQKTRDQGTLQAYYQHQARNDYLAQPGLMDLTAHVNFSYLSQCLLEAHFEFNFFTYQNVFLLDQGIEAHATQKPPAALQKIKRLLDPRLMGENFKVLVFNKNQKINYQPRFDLNRFL